MTSYLPSFLCPFPWKQPLPGWTGAGLFCVVHCSQGGRAAGKLPERTGSAPGLVTVGTMTTLSLKGQGGALVKPGHREGSVATWQELWAPGEGHSQLLTALKRGKWNESCSVVSDSLQPHGLSSPWNSPGQHTEVGSLSLLQGIFPTQEVNQGLLHCRQILYQLSYQGSPKWGN